MAAKNCYIQIAKTFKHHRFILCREPDIFSQISTLLITNLCSQSRTFLFRHFTLINSIVCLSIQNERINNLFFDEFVLVWLFHRTNMFCHIFLNSCCHIPRKKKRLPFNQFPALTRKIDMGKSFTKGRLFFRK